jgi:hypothetical protein
MLPIEGRDASRQTLDLGEGQLLSSPRGKERLDLVFREDAHTGDHKAADADASYGS